MSADSKHVDDGEYWSIRGTKMMGRGREVLEKKKTAQLPLLPPRISHGMACERSRSSAMTDQRLTA